MDVRTLGVAWVMAIWAGCTTVAIDASKIEDYYECRYMKEVCAESEDFEKQYASMSEEEQEEMETILHAYRSQCTMALEACQNNQTAAARFLGLTRAKFRVLLNQVKKDEEE